MTVLKLKAAPILAGIVLTIYICSPVMAQQGATVTLQAIIDSAAHHLPVILEKQALLNSATAAITDASHSRLPQLKVLEEVSGASANSVAGAYFPMSTVPSVSGSIRDQNMFKPEIGNIGMLYSQYDLLDFGLKKAEVQNARAFASLSKSDLEREQYIVKWQAGKAYFDLMEAEYQMSVEQQNLSRYQNIATIIRAVTKSGLRPGSDSSEINAALSQTVIKFNLSQAKVTQLQQQLSYLTGVTPGQLIVDTTLQSQPLPVPVNQALDTAQNPFLTFYGAQINFFKTNHQLIDKTYQPKVELISGIWGRASSIEYNDQYKSLVNGLGFQRYNYAAAVSFVYNLFDGVHRRDKLAVSQYQVEASQAAFQQQQQDLLNELQQEDNNITTEDKNLREMPVQLQAAKDAYEQKLAQYNAGVINLLDLINATYILYQAQTGYVELLNGWYSSNLNKAAITGGLDQFIQTIKK